MGSISLVLLSIMASDVCEKMLFRTAVQIQQNGPSIGHM